MPVEPTGPILNSGYCETHWVSLDPHQASTIYPQMKPHEVEIIEIPVEPEILPPLAPASLYEPPPEAELSSLQPTRLDLAEQAIFLAEQTGSDSSVVNEATTETAIDKEEDDEPRYTDLVENNNEPIVVKVVENSLSLSGPPATK